MILTHDVVNGGLTVGFFTCNISSSLPLPKVFGYLALFSVVLIYLSFLWLF